MTIIHIPYFFHYPLDFCLGFILLLVRLYDFADGTLKHTVYPFSRAEKCRKASFFFCDQSDFMYVSVEAVTQWNVAHMDGRAVESFLITVLRDIYTLSEKKFRERLLEICKLI